MQRGDGKMHRSGVGTDKGTRRDKEKYNGDTQTHTHRLTKRCLYRGGAHLKIANMSQ